MAHVPPAETRWTSTMEALRKMTGGRAVVRVQHSVRAGPQSVPEPDVAVLLPEG